MKTIYKLCLFSIVLLLTACANITVTSDYDRTANFSGYKTFAFYQLTDKSGSLSDLNKDRILKAIKANLMRKGFTETNNNPDLMVNATTIFEDKKRVIANTDYYNVGGYYRPYAWGPYSLGGVNGVTTVNVYDYIDGSLIIDILDTARKQLIWQGTGNKEIDKPSSNPDATINEAVTKIMESFPPNAKTK